MNPGIKTGPIVHLTLDECRRWITVLLKALQPFAYQWEIIASNAIDAGQPVLDHSTHFHLGNSYTVLTIGDMRTAYEAMMDVRQEEMKPR